MKFYFSLDEENFFNCDEFNSYEECFDFAIRELDADVDDTIYIAKGAGYVPKLSAQWLVETLNETASNDVGHELVDDWPNLSIEQMQEMGDKVNDLIHELLKKFKEQKRFDKLTDTKSFVVKVEDIDRLGLKNESV